MKTLEIHTKLTELESVLESFEKRLALLCEKYPECSKSNTDSHDVFGSLSASNGSLALVSSGRSWWRMNTAYISPSGAKLSMLKSRTSSEFLSLASAEFQFQQDVLEALSPVLDWLEGNLKSDLESNLDPDYRSFKVNQLMPKLAHFFGALEKREPIDFAINAVQNLVKQKTGGTTFVITAQARLG